MLVVSKGPSYQAHAPRPGVARPGHGRRGRGGRCAARLEADALAALYPIRPYPNPYNHHYLDRCAARLEADALAALADAAAALRQRAAIERGVHQVGIG